MCLAIPGRIISIKNNLAEVDVMEVICSVNIQLIDDPKLEEYVLIHSGCAIQKISAGESLYLRSVLSQLVIEDDTNG